MGGMGGMPGMGGPGGMVSSRRPFPSFELERGKARRSVVKGRTLTLAILWVGFTQDLASMMGGMGGGEGGAGGMVSRDSSLSSPLPFFFSQFPSSSHLPLPPRSPLSSFFSSPSLLPPH